MRLLVCFIIILSVNQAVAQKGGDSTKVENNLIQFSGIVVDDSLGGIPYAYIYERSTKKGTVSDYYGYFSFVAEKGDTIVFSSVTHKDNYMIIPDTLTSYRYSIIQLLQFDTKELKTHEVYPWPSKDQFIDAFVELELNGNDYAVAQRNLKRQELAAQAQGVNSDSYLSYKEASREQQQKLYYNGQAPSNNLLNPVAWAKFLKSWKNGELKRQ